MAYAKKKKSAKSQGGNQSVAHPQSDVVSDEEHSKLITWVNEADDATIYSRNLSEKCRGYYDTDGQWTAAERAKLENQKQAATVINRCKPKVDSLMGMERANRTTAKAQPRTPKEAKAATAATEATRFALQDNSYEYVRSDTWENMLIEGTGGVEIIVKPAKDDTYKVLIRHIMWDRLIYDPHSRRKDFSDAKFLGQVVWMDYEDALALYPDAQDVLEAMQSGSQTYEDKPRWMDTNRKRVKIVELYYRKDDGDWWYACFTRGGYCKDPQKSPYVNEEGETEHCYEFASLFVGREGDRYGSLKQLLDVQDEINKRRSKALHLMSVRQTFGTAGAVADLNKARAELAKPDGHVEFAYGEMGKDFGVLPTADMAQAQFNLLTEAKAEMDSVGANSATMGKDKTVQSGVALRQRQLTGQTELAPMFDMLKNLDLRVYRKTWNRIRQYWRAEMWVRVTDDENNLKFVGLNKPVTKGEEVLKAAQAQGAPPQMLAQLQQKIMGDPAMHEIVSTENDIAHLDVDMVMDDAPDTVTQEVEDFQAMAEMVKSGFPIPPEAVIMASPLSNKDKILKMMKEQPQVPPKMQEAMEKMQEGMQKAGEEVKKLTAENQALKSDQQTEAAKLQFSAQEAQAKLAQRKEESQAELQLKAQTQAAELQLERERAQAAIELERLKAEAQLQLQDVKMQGDQQQQKAKLEFDQQCRAQDQEAQMQEKAKGEETEVAPQFMKALGEIMSGFQQFMESQNKLNAELVKSLNRPKKVSLGEIRRDDDGSLTGASATVQ